MGKILIYTPIDIYYELVRTQFLEYRNAVEQSRQIPKVVKRLLRIQLVYDSLTEKQKKEIQETHKECYNEFQRIIPVIQKMIAEPIDMTDQQMIQTLLQDKSMNTNIQSIFDLFNLHPEINRSNIKKYIQENFDETRQQYIQLKQNKDDFYIQTRQKRKDSGNYNILRQKREVSSLIFKSLSLKDKKGFYDYNFQLIEKLSQKVKEKLIFAGGTGQFISVIKNKLQNPDNIFSFGDVDVKLKLTKKSNLKKIRYQLISFFSDIINTETIPDFFNISMKLMNFKIESVPVSYYRNIKLKQNHVYNYYRFKQQKNPTPFLFDLIDLYLQEDVLIALIFRLFIHLKITDTENPKLQRIIQLEVLDVAVSIQEGIVYEEGHELYKSSFCGYKFEEIQELEPITIKEVQQILSKNI